MKLRLLAWIASGTMSLFVAGNVLAADCGCETACDSYPAEMGGCDCGCSDCHQSGGLSNGFRKFQDRVKKICDIKWCDWKWLGHETAECDDACDAAMMQDLMLPEEAIIHHGQVYPHAHPVPHPQMLPQVHLPPSGPNTISPPVHIREKGVDTKLFDSLADPFRDDDAQLPAEPNMNVRRSSHDEVVLVPVPRRPLSSNQGTSSRRVKSAR
jgi:hypothetical protein